MLTLLTRRARAQWQLLATLVAVVTLGATLLGTCALLVTRTADRALEVAASGTSAADAAVTAYTVTIADEDAAEVAADTRALLTESLAPFPIRTTGRASSVLRSLPQGAGYLSAVEDLPSTAELSSGRWPAAPGEAAVLETTARQLGLQPGTRVRLGAELGRAPAPPTAVTVVGIVRPLAGSGWDRDPLGGAGFNLAYRDASSLRDSRAFGPFLVGWDELLTGGSALDRLEITAYPDLSAPRLADLDAVTSTVLGADRRLARDLGDRVQIERIASRLPSVLAAARHQQQVTNAAVLSVAVLGGLLTAVALALAGRLTTDLRSGESALLSSFGAGRGQLARLAAVEGAALALLAAAIAIPASSLLHAALTHLPPLSGAGLASAPMGTAAQVLAVALGAVVLAVMMVVAGLRPAPATAERTRRDLLARSGADLLLVALGVAGWWQLRAQPAGDSAGPDAVRVLAPTLLLVAGAALALRLAPPALALADRAARRANSLPLPLAAFEAARRPQATAAGLLVTLACAAGTFGVALDATWERSQRDQATLAVGTDLSLTLGRPPAAGEGATVAGATGGTVSPATDRGVAVGQWLGGSGDAPRLVAVDTARAGALLRGRLDDGRTWADVGARIAAPAPAAGLPVTGTLTLTGTATGGARLTVTPELLFEDATGLRTTCAGGESPLDGRPHRLVACVPPPGVRVVAVALPVTGDSITWDATTTSDIAVTLAIPGTERAAAWTATSAAPSPEQLTGPAVASTGTGLTLTGTVLLGGPPEAARKLVATAFADPGPVPVAVSAGFAGDLGVRPGGRLDLTIGLSAVPVTIADVVPAVPSAPGGAAMLADLDTLSRALAVRGDFASPVDAWWVGDPVRTDLSSLHLGEVVTRAGETARLTGGPVPAGFPAVLRLLVPAAALLLLAGVILHVTCDLQNRALEVARLRGLGMTRREIRRTLVGQHAVVLLPLWAAGGVVGALATWIVAPLLVRSESGASPVPDVVAVWPWPAQAGLLLALLAACLLAVTAVVLVQSRRADAAHLRVAS
ncbi:putative permease [Actinoplanes missouriensis 431]|uniref:Putative permease n=1 Tax=Actinoplanes missouriensis (strain ATCC 14538 / DSM 43046 / CBS 188.64 / JCM 3121 / NBRC 102363 / NCIMB 12654 / NRRL B-3342 / UNCC 431) TaxID=512565 RepID=I0H3E1_ACTM4|nr:FtsX-like permease family protein [Actinoplanes missouriensis]BAL87528.1 putative permease [Actinoplanes missouriensis 431]